MSPCILSTCSYLYTIPPPLSLQALPHPALSSDFITHAVYTHTQTGTAAASLANNVRDLDKFVENIFLKPEIWIHGEFQRLLVLVAVMSSG